MRRYTLILLGALLALLAAFAGFNLVVDPYDVTQWVYAPGLNAKKTRAEADGDRVRVGDRLVRGGYGTVFLGNSRFNEGLKEADLPWGGRAFNAAMGAADVFEVGRSAVLAGRQPGLRCAVLSLEPEFFNSTAKAHGAYWLSALPDGSRPLAVMRQALAPKTFNRAIQTIAENNGGHVKPAQWKPVYAPGEELGRFVDVTRNSFAAARSYGYDHERVRFLAAVVDRLTQRGVQVIGVFSPAYAWREEALRRADGKGDYARFRREVVTALDRYAHRRPRAPCAPGGAVQLWDFTGYQPLDVTPPPGPAQTAPAPWFYESSHFTPRVGAALLRRVAGLPTEGGPLAPEVFGVRVTPATLPAVELEAEARRRAWLATDDGRRAVRLIEAWRRSDQPEAETRRFFLTRDDWKSLDRDLPDLEK